MKTLSLKLTLLGLFSSVMACSPSKSDGQKALEHAQQSVERAQKEMDTTVKEAQNTADTAADAAHDATGSGGQPGSISLSGALVQSATQLDARVSLSSTSGLSWRGVRPQTASTAISLKSEVSVSARTAVEKLASDEHFVNMGCDASVTQGIDQHLTLLESNPLEQQSSVRQIKAHTVFLCDASQLKNAMIFIEAQTLIVHSFALTLSGSVDHMISLNAAELVLENENSIQAIAVDGPSTLLAGPSMAISAGRLSGGGTLKLEAQGSNYKKSQP